MRRRRIADAVEPPLLTHMRFLRACVFSLGAIASLGWIAVASEAQAPVLSVTTLSSRPDMVSGDDALVEISGPELEEVDVMLNGREVTNSFHPDPARRSLVGLVAGLRLGANTIVARAGDVTASLALTNFPTTGPIVSGEHLSPFSCGTEEAGLGAPLDADCSAATTVEYFYKSSSPAAARSPFKPLPHPTAPRPADLARTKTIDGNTVPYIVRVESGTIDRAIYRIAVLDDPSVETPDGWTPGAGWNRRLVFSFGGGCGLNYTQGVNHPSDVLVDGVLSRGFAHATSTANVFQQYCNDQLSGEALMMIKEHIIERYGVLAWTVGVGGSGGAIQQLLIAQNFPGLLDGLLPSLTFPDALSIAPSVSDCRLLEAYFARHPEAWTATKRQAIEGYAAGTCRAWDKAFGDVLAFRGSVAGLSGRPLDNVGVQYGLQALNRGAITKVEFLDLNAAVGGFDPSGRLRGQRTSADPTVLKLAYATGRINAAAGGLPSVPIIQYRSYDDARGTIHDRARDFTVRERLRRANGNADNQVLWTYPSGVPGLDERVSLLALDTMTQWLDTLTKDNAATSQAQKTRHAKPAAAVDACWDIVGSRINEPATFDRPSICNALYPSHANPRLVAGAPVVDDVLKCQLKAIDPRDYRVTFGVDELLKLRLTFPNGVCDYSKAGMSQVPLAGTFLVMPRAGAPQ